jgi:hypothetical protein
MKELPVISFNTSKFPRINGKKSASNKCSKKFKRQDGIIIHGARD